MFLNGWYLVSVLMKKLFDFHPSKIWIFNFLSLKFTSKIDKYIALTWENEKVSLANKERDIKSKLISHLQGVCNIMVCGDISGVCVKSQVSVWDKAACESESDTHSVFLSYEFNTHAPLIRGLANLPSSPSPVAHVFLLFLSRTWLYQLVLVPSIFF